MHTKYQLHFASVRSPRCVPRTPNNIWSDGQWLQLNVWGQRTPSSALVPKFQRWPPAIRTGSIRCWCEWIFDAIFAFLLLNLYLCCLQQAPVSSIILHRCCHLVVYNRSCSVPLRPTVHVHFCELGGAGTLFANNRKYRNAVPSLPKTL